MSPVVLLPSLGRPASDFGALVAALRASGREAVAVDLPGVGDTPALPASGDLHDLAADVADRIAPMAATAHLVGHAFGQPMDGCRQPDRGGDLRAGAATP